MTIEPLPIEGAYLITIHPIKDRRGYFVRCIDYADMQGSGLSTAWVQENQSFSKNAYTVRGLHYQAPPAAETKLIHVVKGSLFDVMVDLRAGSSSYGQWFGMTLSESSHQMLYIPKGCAHGFCTLLDDTVIQYKVDAAYAPEYERGLYFRDQDLAIEWPIPENVTVHLSDKDQQAPRWVDLENTFREK